MDSLKLYQDAGLDDKGIINCLSQEVTALRAFKDKHELEFSRYKQDCRKRALDIAADKGWSAGKDHALKLADELYQWLITIPQ